MNEVWRSAIRAAATRFPRTLDDRALTAHVEAAIAAGALAAHADDVVLAWAVARGDAQAVAEFERVTAGEVTAAARKVDRDPAFVDEIRQAVRVRLAIGDPTPRIASYHGTGPLRAWVAIAALRVALNARRDRPPEDVLAEVVDREPDPGLRHLKTLYRAEYKAALAGAIGKLGDRERALLRLRFVSGLPLDAIGKLYRVHESTASRWVAAAVEAVGAGARAELVARLSISNATADSVARMVASQLDLSIARLL